MKNNNLPKPCRFRSLLIIYSKNLGKKEENYDNKFNWLHSMIVWRLKTLFHRWHFWDLKSLYALRFGFRFLTWWSFSAADFRIAAFCSFFQNLWFFLRFRQVLLPCFWNLLKVFSICQKFKFFQWNGCWSNFTLEITWKFHWVSDQCYEERVPRQETSFILLWVEIGWWRFLVGRRSFWFRLGTVLGFWWGSGR